MPRCVKAEENGIKHPSSLLRTICFCYRGKTMESHHDVNAIFVYEVINYSVLFVSYFLLYCEIANYADSPLTCAMMLTEYISNVVDGNFEVTSCC